MAQPAHPFGEHPWAVWLGRSPRRHFDAYTAARGLLLVLDTPHAVAWPAGVPPFAVDGLPRALHPAVTIQRRPDGPAEQRFVACGEFREAIASAPTLDGLAGPLRTYLRTWPGDLLRAGFRIRKQPTRPSRPFVGYGPLGEPVAAGTDLADLAARLRRWRADPANRLRPHPQPDRVAARGDASAHSSRYDRADVLRSLRAQAHDNGAVPAARPEAGNARSASSPPPCNAPSRTPPRSAVRLPRTAATAIHHLGDGWFRAAHRIVKHCAPGFHPPALAAPPTPVLTRRQLNIARLAPGEPLHRETRRFYAFKAGALGNADVYAGRIARSLACDFDLVVPVPLSPDRAAARAPHRTRALARALAVRLGVPAADVLELAAPVTKHGDLPRRPTAAQRRAWTSRYARNLRVRPHGGTHRRVLLVDDAVSTGTTLGLCRDFLAGAWPASCVAVAAATRFTPPPRRPDPSAEPAP